MALTKLTTVSGNIETKSGIAVNVSFNYKDPASIKSIDFNFNKDGVNVFGSFDPSSMDINNYSVSGGIIGQAPLDEAKALIAEIAANPEDSKYYQ